MLFRPGKLLLILLVPVLLYGGLKAILYYNAKSTVDDFVLAVSNQAAIRYADITTDLRGAVTVSGISVQPVGYQDTLGIDSVRVASDDPMFFIRTAEWQPGENTPPPSLSFYVNGMRLPLSSDLIKDAGSAMQAPDEPGQICAQGLNIEPGMLSRIGFTELSMDLDGYYSLNEEALSLDFGMNLDLHDIESLQLSASMTNVDVDTLSRGGVPQMNLGGFSVSVRISPEFGRRALKTCAMGTDETVQEWGNILADKALAQLQQQGLSLGSGLEAAVRRFYQDWGEFKMVAAPPQPVGLPSLMFLPPAQLAKALSLRLSLNDEPITDTSFTWQQSGAKGLSGLLGAEQPEVQNEGRPRRIIVRREYESVRVLDLASYIDHQVKIQPRGLPMREGSLKAISNGVAEVQQTLQGGKFTVYVPLADIESAQALIRRELPPQD
ncbi:MAG: hypothetical protein WBM71_05470 [Sedimenticolaceae bacterium]